MSIIMYQTLFVKHIFSNHQLYALYEFELLDIEHCFSEGKLLIMVFLITVFTTKTLLSAFVHSSNSTVE